MKTDSLFRFGTSLVLGSAIILGFFFASFTYALAQGFEWGWDYGWYDPCVVDPYACGYVDPYVPPPLDPEPVPTPEPTPTPAPEPVPSPEPVAPPSGGGTGPTQEEVDAHNAQVAADAMNWFLIASQEAEQSCGQDMFWSDGCYTIPAPTVETDELGRITQIACGNGALFTFVYMTYVPPPQPQETCETNPALPGCTPPETCATNPSLPECTFTPPPPPPDPTCGDFGLLGDYPACYFVGDPCSETDPPAYCFYVPETCDTNPSLPECTYTPLPETCETNPSLPECISLPPPPPPAPAPLLSITADKIRVRTGETVRLSWNANTAHDFNCSVFGPNVGPITFNPSVDGATGSRQSSGITAKSEFTLSCTDPINGAKYSDSVVVEVAGNLEET